MGMRCCASIDHVMYLEANTHASKQTKPSSSMRRLVCVDGWMVRRYHWTALVLSRQSRQLVLMTPVCHLEGSSESYKPDRDKNGVSFEWIRECSASSNPRSFTYTDTHTHTHTHTRPVSHIYSSLCAVCVSPELTD